MALVICIVAAVALLAPAFETSAQEPSGQASSDLRLRDGREAASFDYYYYPRANYVWPYAAGPYYGKVRTSTLSEPGVIHTRVGSFRLNGGELPFPAELMTQNKLGREAAQYYIVQVHPDTVTREARESLEDVIRAQGGEVMRYLPVSAMIARLTPKALVAVQGAPGLIAVEPYHPAFKIDSTVGRQPLLTREAATSEVWNLDIALFRGEDAKAVAAMIKNLGGEVTKVWPHRIQASVHFSRLAEVAALEPVYAIFEHQGVVPMGQETSNMMQTGAINFDANPFHEAGIRGAGQRLYVLDDGLSLDAADLSDTSASPGSAGPAHRKVLSYVTTAAFGGTGDAAACDAPAQGGFTHGHFVTAAAIGNAEFNDQTFQAVDVNGNTWAMRGVAPDGKVVFYDALVTPAIGACGDPQLGLLDTGTLYDGVGGGSLEAAYATHSVRSFVTPFGVNVNTYDVVTEELDGFLNANRDAFLVVSAGNNGRDANNDGFSDPGSIQKLGTSKNAIVVGSSGSPDDHGAAVNGLERSQFSAVGPAAQSLRVAPLLMGPGQERGATGVNAEYACRSADNDNVGAVICDQVSGKAGTSFAAANVAGAGLLVRDYFAQGFYPDGTSSNTNNATDVVSNVSGALVKAILINSAEFLGVAYDGEFPTGSENLRRRARFNDEQGYGRVQLDNALPLSNWAVSPSGLIVLDGGIDDGGVANINDLGGTMTGKINAVAGATQEATIEVCDDTQDLRLALAYTEGIGDFLINNLDLELVSPSGRIYYGNYFTDDDDRDGVADPGTEDCGCLAGGGDAGGCFNDGTPLDQGLDRSEYSIQACVRGNATLPPHDSVNPTEAIVLSANPEERTDPDSGDPILTTGTCSVSADPCGYDAQCPGAEVCNGGTSQVEAGTWTVRVIARAGGAAAVQRYALAITGGVCRGSSARLDATAYVCNSEAQVTVNEVGEAADPAGGLSVAEVASRTTVEVLDGDTLAVLDTESGDDLGFSQPDANVLQFVAESVQVTDGTAYDSGNGVLDVRSGNLIRVSYQDQTNGSSDSDKLRTVTAEVSCKAALLAGATTFGDFGKDNTFLIVGGCERNARGLFEFGFPDKYMDAGEAVKYRFAFASIEQADLEQAEVSLTCKRADADSPPSCKYEDAVSASCPDPTRSNNASCGSLIDVLDATKTIGLIQAGAGLSVDWEVLMGTDAAFAAAGAAPQVDMILLLKGQSSGKTASFGIANRHVLNVDEVSKYYNTDFPQGGVEFYDRDNNGLIENPKTTGPAGFPTSSNTDYFFETRTWSDMTACVNAAGSPVACNTGLQAPWFFDANNGGFTSGLVAGSDEGAIAETIAQWGEDKNFNDKLDGRCAAAPSISCDIFPLDVLNCPSPFDCINLEERDPVNFPQALLDQNWSTLGGCGWQTRAPGTCSDNANQGCYNDDDCDAGVCSGAGKAKGGAWHTGNIGSTTGSSCHSSGCQIYETIGGTSGQLNWFEILTTPVVEKVNKAVGATGTPVARIEIEEFRWNSAIDLPDNNVSWTIEVDTDVDKLEPVDLKSDFVVIWTGTGEYGAVSAAGNPDLTRGWPLFAPLNPGTGQSFNGDTGGNRGAKNSCFFEGGAVLGTTLDRVGLPGPPDDDAPEGYCPFGNGFGGPDTFNTSTDSHLNYCTLTCSDAQTTPCSDDASCQGTCINPGLNGFCGNEPSRSCTTNAQCDLGTCVDIKCNGTCSNNVCTTSGNACASNADCTHACVFTTGTIDEFVTPAGPVRNVETNDFNGPDMRFTTLEDVFGDTGNRFQGAIGFQNREAQGASEAVSGFGMAVDDVVIQWREFTLDADQTSCATSGSCASVNLQTNNIYQGKTVVEVTVVDSSPQAANDCDLDGDLDGTRDCDGNGIDDVVVRVTSPQELAGEIVFANLTGQSTYKGSVPISSAFNLPGTLFIAVQGNQNPTITAVYLDNDDGTGQICQNNVTEDAWGRIQTTSTVFITPASVQVTRSFVSDNGDDDGWADTGETVRMRVEVSNKSGAPLTGLTLRATSNDPEIACITIPFLSFGDLGVGETRFSDDEFEFVVATNVQRANIFQDLTATLSISADANEFQSPAQPQSLTFDLDLDATGGTGPTTFFEGFEGGLGQFTSTGYDIDTPLNPPPGDLGNQLAGRLNANGFRCQYSDPDWEGSVSYGSSQAPVCFPNPNNTPDNYWWQTSADRAFSGASSLYFGLFLNPALGFTTPTAQLEAVGTAAPVNLGWDKICEIDRTIFCDSSADCPAAGGGGAQACVPAQPTFTFKHQASLLDHRTINASPFRTPDRGVVQGQLADGDGAPQGVWIKLVPFVNAYDKQANSNYFNCTFDPVDDGNDEGSFFDPTDPARFFGPSSTCAPEFVFTENGETGSAFNSENLGFATDGPGLQGASGLGTWVESKVDLSRFRGRRINMRFLFTNLKLGGVLHWEAAFVFNPDPRDDGWFIDDVAISDTLTTPASVSPDSKTPPAGNPCAGTCLDTVAAVVADPAITGAPGQVVHLSAATSTTGRCIGGVLQYLFAIDVDRDGVYDPGLDVIIRDWTDNDEIVVTPQGDQSFIVGARCGSGSPSDPECSGFTSTAIDVSCPTGPAGLGSGGSTGNAFLDRNASDLRDIVFSTKTTLIWPTGATVDLIRGNLNTLRTNLGFGGAGEVTTCLLNNGVSAVSAVDAATPAAGQGFFYLGRSAENCNLKAGGSWGQVGETGNRDAGIIGEGAACAE